MRTIKLAMLAGAMGLASTAVVAAPAVGNGKILIVLSSASHLDLKDGKRYDTGYFLNERAVPLKALQNAGYTPVFADPDGKAPVMDAHSNDATGSKIANSLPASSRSPTENSQRRSSGRSTRPADWRPHVRTGTHGRRHWTCVPCNAMNPS